MKGAERSLAALLWIMPAALVVLGLYVQTSPPGESGVSASAATASTAGAAQGQRLFESTCAGCHTLGGGRGVGPDLAGISARRERDFIIRYTVEPDVLHAEGHPIALELAAEYPFPMPNVGVTRTQAEQILAYLDDRSAELAPPALAPGEAPPAATPEPTPLLAGDAERGADLFTGRVRFANAGASCAACHTAAGAGPFGGGTLARDLTDLHTRLGELGVTGVLGSLTAFPVMDQVYRDKPLTDQERADLLAFFQDSAGATDPGPPIWLYPAAGLGGLAVLLLLTVPLALRGGPGVRRRLVEGARLRGAGK
jgi:mono/diheme cytochrome c family protein